MTFQNVCLKCGTCCQKNSPVLHLGDKHLIENRLLKPANLVLLRKGEPAMDNILGKPVLLKKELIKIKGKGTQKWDCVFHDAESKLCLIHAERPIQCRALKCWDPDEIFRQYSKDTLSRKDVIVRGSALEEIIIMHEEKCRIEEFTDLLRSDIKEPGQAGKDINRMISFDKWFRKNFQEKTGSASSYLDYYFGRSLEQVSPAIIRFIRKGNM